MKKIFLYITGIVIFTSIVGLLGLYSFTASLVPKISKEKINFDNPNHALVQLSEKINIEKVQLEKNYSRLSNVDWCNYDKKKFQITDMFAEINDYHVRNANQLLIHYMMIDYVTRAGIKLKENHDTNGARADIDEFEKLVERNKYISNYQETKDFVKRFREKNGL